MATLKAWALTSLSDVKESLGIQSSDTTYDNLIIRKINQATAVIENYCSRRFKSTPYADEVYNATDTDELVLKQRPVITSEAFTLKARDTALNENDTTTVDTELYFIDANAGVLNLNHRAIGHWARYLVTYTAGYATIPDDLAEACASLAAYYVNNADAFNVNVSSKEEGQRRVSYSGGLSSPADLFSQLGIEQTIDQYVNIPLNPDI